MAFIAHFLKWPTAVNEFLRVLAAGHPRPWTAVSFACAVLEATQFFDGKQRPEMLKGMNVAKRMIAKIGVAVFGRSSGILAKCDAEEHMAQGGSPAATVIRLEIAGSAAAKPAGSAVVRQRLKRKSAGSSAAKAEVRLGRPLILPDVLATWCLAADDAKDEAN